MSTRGAERSGAAKSGRSGKSDRSHAAGSGGRGAGGAADRPGNNGTVKIDDLPFDSHPNNEPHVGCAFQVDFYNYGAGDLWADVHFAAHPPTLGGRAITTTVGDDHPFIGEDPPGGGTDVDAQQTYQLPFTGSPHPKQGYHVKLTINAPRSLGADTKHKVFWVRPCASAEQPPAGQNPPGENPPGGGGEVPPGEVPPGGGGENPPVVNPPGGGGEVPPGEVAPGGGGENAPGGVTPPGGSVPGENGQPQNPGVPGSGTSPVPVVQGSVSGSQVTRPTGNAAAGRQGASAAAAGSGVSGQRAAQVPTAVEAGLAGKGAHSDLDGSLATSLLGLCGLLTAAWVAAYQRRGTRQP